MTQIKVQSQPSEVVTNDPAVSKNPFYRYKSSSVSNLPTKTGDFSTNKTFNPTPDMMKSTQSNPSGKDNQIKGKLGAIKRRAGQK